MDQTEAELERFRQQWREEVSAKTKPQKKYAEQPKRTQASSSKTSHAKKSSNPPLPQAHYPKDVYDGSDEVGSRTQHDLKEKEVGRKLGDDDYGTPSSSREPNTALEHYEKAVEKEGQGSLGDSLSLYRKAFRMDSNVHESYKKKHFPPTFFSSSSKATNPNPSNASVTVPNTAHHSLTALPPTVSELIGGFSGLSIQGEPAPTDLSPAPPCPISEIPEEILSHILLALATTDVASFARLSLVCKRLAYLALTEDSIWKTVIHGHEFGLAAMHYRYACTLLWDPLSVDAIDDSGADITLDTSLIVTTPPLMVLPLSPTYPTYRQMFRSRPRLRFNGCYISTVNYTRPGASSSNNLTWNSPVLIVTYYRYLRFFRDGSVISLLTTSEPSDVVPWLQKEHVHGNHSGGLPQWVMKDALKGRWRLSGDPWGTKARAKAEAGIEGVEGVETEQEEEQEPETEPEPEPEGELHIETEGVTKKYMYKMHLQLGSAGKGTRNNKLAWKGYWSWNRLTDDWGEFGLKNDRPFYWSRVKSFGTGL